MKTSVVIPNWQGKDLLERNLPSVLKLGADEIIIIDDCSSDGSVNFLEKHYPGIKLIRHKTNQGFSISVNDGVKTAKGEIIILLNTDVSPDKNLIKAVESDFIDNRVFAVSFNEGKWGPARAVFSNGLIEHRAINKGNITQKSFWASGGSAAFSRNKWIELGGLDDIYKPFYWEDVDISYRALAQGYSILWNPNALVEHQHEATIGKYFKTKKRLWIVERNQILFFWINISSPILWLRHIFLMPTRLIKLGYWIPFLWALVFLPNVVIRKLQRRNRIVSDENILEEY